MKSSLRTSQAAETKKEEKPKKPTLSPEMKELLEQEKAIVKVRAESERGSLQTRSIVRYRQVMFSRRCVSDFAEP